MGKRSSGSLTREDYLRAERFLPGNQGKLVFRDKIKPNWIASEDRFWYKVDTCDGKEFVLVDPTANTQGPAFDHLKLAAVLSVATATPCEANMLPFDAIEWLDGGKQIAFTVGNSRWICDPATYELKQEEASAPVPRELLSPDGTHSAFVREHNLYVRVAATGDEVQLTSDGVEYNDYASSPESNTHTVTSRLSGALLPPVAVWSPDSKRLITHRLDQRQVLPLRLLQSVPPSGQRPVLHSYRYAMPGDKYLPLAQMMLFDIERRSRTLVTLEPEECPFLTPIEFRYVWWEATGDKAYYLVTERGHRCLRLYEIDAVTGSARLMIEERGTTLVETNLFVAGPRNVRVLGDGAEVIWFSQRDGWAHLYLYDGKTGALKNRITSGEWVVRDILKVDEAQRTIWFSAGGRDSSVSPLCRTLAVVRLDGADLSTLTPEPADHEVSISPSADCFVDTYSRADLAPVTVLRRADGALVRTLEEADIEALLETGWRWPEPFRVKARDGVTNLYGKIYRPADFDPGRSYPVLDSIYPGPQAPRTSPGFGLDVYGQADAITQLGFVVVTLDGQGTPGRSKAFHDFQYGKFEEVGGLADHIVGLCQLADRYPYMDLSRVGIYGHSGGGFASTHAILAFPDFFKVAVSSAGNHDQRGYLAGWGERYMGLPVGDSYVGQSNASLAANLKGKLLLMYGDMDDNVHGALTLQVVDALIKANKDFDLLVLPNRNHAFCSNDPYYLRRLWDYFVRHLLEKEPPQGALLTVPMPNPPGR